MALAKEMNIKYHLRQIGIAFGITIAIFTIMFLIVGFLILLANSLPKIVAYLVWTFLLMFGLMLLIAYAGDN